MFFMLVVTGVRHIPLVRLGAEKSSNQCTAKALWKAKGLTSPIKTPTVYLESRKGRILALPQTSVYTPSRGHTEVNHSFQNPTKMTVYCVLKQWLNALMSISIIMSQNCVCQITEE